MANQDTKSKGGERTPSFVCEAPLQAAHVTAGAEGGWPPLVDGLVSHTGEGYLGFHMPGHHQGRAAWAPWRDLLGEAVFALDLTELPGLDNIQDPQGIIKQAAGEAAALFGAAETHLLVNGASAGILAVLLALCREGGAMSSGHGAVLVPRNCHQSVVHGLVLSGATPVYLPVRFHPGLGLPGLLRTEDLRPVLDSFSGRCLLVLPHPNYYGLAGDLAEQIALAHRHGLTVLVDEAHGAHFRASSLFPAPALTAGADFTVMGAHKTLGAFTQAAWLHCRERGEAASRVGQALRLVQTTSPSYLLMASLDVARRQLQQSGGCWEETAGFGRRLREEISRIPGLRAPGEELLGVPGVTDYDPARLVVNVSGLGITGFAAAGWLQKERRLLVEMADLMNLVFILSPGDLGPAADALLHGLRDLAAAWVDAGGECESGKSVSGGKRGEHGEQLSITPSLCQLPIPRQALTPRQAFLAPQRPVPLAEAAGKVAAGTITPYPPGVPLICPGEVIDQTVLKCLAAWCHAGGTWPGQAGGAIYVVDGS